jgi:cyclic beta-1,2-glucan synthetase
MTTAGPSCCCTVRARWSEGEQAWIGRERKRGKLEDLNAFLRGGARERFSARRGRYRQAGRVRYVITLDADTQLPRDAHASSSPPWRTR